MSSLASLGPCLPQTKRSSIPRVRRESSQAYLSTAPKSLGVLGHPCLGPGLPEVLRTQAELCEGPMRCRCPSFAGTEWAPGGGLGEARRVRRKTFFVNSCAQRKS